MSGQPDLQSLLDNVEALKRYQFKDAGEKRQAMNALRAASDGLQHPFDKILEMWGSVSGLCCFVYVRAYLLIGSILWVQAPKDAAMKVCIDTNLFKKWKAAGKVKTASELAEMAGVDIDLIRKLCVICELAH